MRNPRPRTRPVLLALAGIATLLLGVAPSAGAAAPVRTKPSWLPVHTAFGLDCAGKNPGCTGSRRFFSIDVIPSGQFGRKGHPSHARVYAMGGGVVHIGNAHGARCGSGGRGSFGTWLSINHGNGVSSRYGHLSKILVHKGQHVAAGTPIGVVGTTGKSANCRVNYLDFEIDHGAGSKAHAVTFSTLLACTPAGRRQVWPKQAATTKAFQSRKRVHFATWEKAPKGTQFPASSGSCI